MCVDVDTIHRISGVRSNYRKSEWYRNARMSRHEDNLFSFTDPVLHKERKKYVVPGVRAIHLSQLVAVSGAVNCNNLVSQR